MTTETLKTLIVDDESLARRGLAHRLQTIEGIEIVGEAQNGREALRLIRELNPDLVFLDIQMPGLGGFEVVQQLDEETMPVILFLTAYDEYAVRPLRSMHSTTSSNPLTKNACYRFWGRLKPASNRNVR